MKNYIEEEKLISMFINNYEVYDDEIVINYADNNKVTISRNIENEVAILNKMKQQVLDSDKYKEDIFQTIKVCKVVISVFVFSSVGILLIGLPFVKNIIDFVYLLGGILLFTSPAYIGLGSTIKREKLILKDIEKNLLFINNEKLFKDKINKDLDISINIKDITKKTIDKLIVEKKESIVSRPNINDLDKISYDTVYDIYDLINDEKESSNVKKKIRKK